jgi:hypothetical protein
MRAIVACVVRDGVLDRLCCEKGRWCGEEEGMLEELLYVVPLWQ